MTNDYAKYILFGVVFLCMTFLVYSGKVDLRYLELLLALVFPSPVFPPRKPEALP